MVTLSSWLSTAWAETTPDYFFGKWEIRTYGYNLKKDGALIVFNPDDGSKLDEGTWHLDGDKIVIKTGSIGVQSVKFRIVSKDSWEWISTKDRIWDATRLK